MTFWTKPCRSRNQQRFENVCTKRVWASDAKHENTKHSRNELLEAIRFSVMVDVWSIKTNGGRTRDLQCLHICPFLHSRHCCLCCAWIDWTTYKSNARAPKRAHFVLERVKSLIFCSMKSNFQHQWNGRNEICHHGMHCLRNLAVLQEQSLGIQNLRGLFAWSFTGERLLVKSSTVRDVSENQQKRTLKIIWALDVMLFSPT